MDVAPSHPNGRVVVLLHGKNFCGATWEATIARPTAAGYPVIAPRPGRLLEIDQAGALSDSFHQLAANTRAPSAASNIERAIIVGHSMGGMLAARYAVITRRESSNSRSSIRSASRTRRRRRPFGGIDEAYRTELQTTFDRIKAYQGSTTMASGSPSTTAGTRCWRHTPAPAGAGSLEPGPHLRHGLYPARVHELRQMRPRTLLLIGGKDRTAPGANRASAEIAQRLGNYPELGRCAARAIPNAKLVEFRSSVIRPRSSAGPVPRGFAGGTAIHLDARAGLPILSRAHHRHSSKAE